MEQSLIDALRRIYAATEVNAGLAELEPLLAEDVTLRPTGQFMDVAGGGDLHGREAAKQFFTEVEKAFEHIRYELRGLHVFGSAVVAELVFHAEGRGSGIPVENEIWHVLHLHDGRIGRIEVFLTRDEALVAARAG